MTLRRVFAGVVIGVAGGLVLGLVMGSVLGVRSVLEPWLTFLRARLHLAADQLERTDHRQRDRRLPGRGAPDRRRWREQRLEENQVTYLTRTPRRLV
jgi:hypothetical protein